MPLAHNESPAPVSPLNTAELDRAVGVQCLGDVGQEDGRVVVAVVERDPGELAIVACRPLGKGRRLAVSRWCHDAHEPTVLSAREAVDEAGALD